MVNKILNNKYLPHIITLLGFICSCLFMYNFYKCLSGYIANGFRYGMLMPTMFISYFTPVLAFLFYFFHYYVKKLPNVTRYIYSFAMISLCVFNIVGIIINFEIYLNNNLLGSYQSIPSIIVTFPFDGLLFNAFLIGVQVVNILVLMNKSKVLGYIQDKFNHQGKVKIYKGTYVLLSVLAIFTFVFVGDFFCGLQAIENTLYDARYLFLLLWVLLLPLINLLLIVFKVELRDFKKKTKVTLLGSGIFLNIVFGLLILIFELVTPSFMVHIAKPLFPITYSVSLPIEAMVILGIQAIGTLVLGYRLIKLLLQKEN